MNQIEHWTFLSHNLISISKCCFMQLHFYFWFLRRLSRYFEGRLGNLRTCSLSLYNSVAVVNLWISYTWCFIFTNICIAVADPVIKRVGWDTINLFNLATFACLSRGRTRISPSHICNGRFIFNDLRRLFVLLIFMELLITTIFS